MGGKYSLQLSILGVSIFCNHSFILFFFYHIVYLSEQMFSLAKYINYINNLNLPTLQ